MPRDASGGRAATAAEPAVADDVLARAAAAGDAFAFATLIDRHYERFYRLAWRWCGSQTEAEDAAQDICVKLSTAIRSWRGEAAFSTWAYRLAFTTTTDRIRARQRLRLVEPSQMTLLVDANEQAPETDAETKMINDDLWTEVRRLPDQQRDAVLLVYAEDMSHAQAAAVMGCTEKTVSWHLHEARKRLRAKLEASA